MIKLGIIGCGKMADSFLERFHYVNDEFEVVAAVDLDIQRAKKVAETFQGIVTTTRYTEIFGYIDAALVVLPHHLHHEVALDCIKAGKHVLLEKPMAITELQCIELIQAAESKQKILMIGYVMRYHRLTLAFKDALDKATIGNVFQLSIWTEQYTEYPEGHWANSAKTLGGGQLFSHGCHYIDLLMWFLGKPVSGTHLGTNFGTPWMEKEGTSNVSIKFENGSIGYHFGTWGARGTRLGYSFHAHGEKGMLEANFGENKLILHKSDRKPKILYSDCQSIKQTDNELLHFARCIRTGGLPDTDARSSLQSLRVIWKLYESELKHSVADLRGLGLTEVENTSI
jgi:predicted dehydrogenase